MEIWRFKYWTHGREHGKKNKRKKRKKEKKGKRKK